MGEPAAPSGQYTEGIRGLPRGLAATRLALADSLV